MEIKELLNRYITEIGNHLPEKNRVDIEQEIRSLLEDSLEDRSQKEGRQPDETMVVHLLKAYGAPQQVAANYFPQRYLVGPRLYPYFLNAVRILFLVLTIVILVTTAIPLIETGLQPTDFGLAVLKGFGNFINGGLTGFGTLAFAFWIIQRSLSEDRQNTLLKEWDDWDPRKLEAIPQPEGFKMGSMIAKITLNLVAILIFNGYIDHVGIYNFINGEWQFIPVLAPVFYQYLPWLSFLWALTIGQCILVLGQGSWQSLPRGFAIVLDVYTALLVLVMLVGAPLVAFSPEALSLYQSLRISSITLIQAENGVVMLTKMILMIILTIKVVDLVKPLYKKLIKTIFTEAQQL